MNWQSIPYILPLSIAVVIPLTLAAIAWRHRVAPGARPLALLMLALVAWSLSYALSLLGQDLATQLFWANMTYFSIVLVPPTWLTFAYNFIGRDQWLTRRNLALLAIMPLVTLLVVSTDPYHGLFRSEVGLDESGASPFLVVTLGPAFWVHTAYSYALLAAGAIVLIRDIMRSPHLYRRQAGTMVIGMFIPLIGNVIYLSGLWPWPGLDLTPFVFTLGGMVLVLGVVRFRLLDLVPVARNALIEQMSDGVIVIDAQDRVVDINPAACHSVGCHIGEIIGQAAGSVFAHQPDLCTRYRDVMVSSAEVTLTGEDGRRSFDLRVTPLRDRSGNASGRLIVLRDITERKQAEEALYHAKEAAEAANRSKSAFLRNMSHELRTPLSAIIGYNALVQQTAQDLELADVIADTERINEAGQHLLDLINDLLDLSRIEAGQATLTRETFAIVPFLHELVATLQPLVTQKGNTLLLHYDNDPGTMHTDKLKLRQVLLNLLGNAAKFTKNGTIVLEVTVDQFAASANDQQAHAVIDRQLAIIFCVSDTGIGMTVEQMSRLFQVFTQGDEEIGRNYGGTGLGLALSRYLCQLLGGDISVTSEVGVGSSFTVTLPIDVLSAVAETRLEPV